MTANELELIRHLEWMRSKFTEPEDGSDGVVLNNIDGIEVRGWMKSVDALIARSRLIDELRMAG